MSEKEMERVAQQAGITPDELSQEIQTFIENYLSFLRRRNIEASSNEGLDLWHKRTEKLASKLNVHHNELHIVCGKAYRRERGV